MSGIASKLDEELRTLRDDVLRLSSMVDTAMQTAMRAVWEFKPTVAQEVIRDDTAINDFRFKIEERCYILLAMQQPTARDMRSVITASHTVVELERIADYAVGNAKLVLQMENASLVKSVSELPRMNQISREMLKSALDAYIRWDHDLAQNTLKRDDEVDALDKAAFERLLAMMLKHKRHVSDATYLLCTAHNLERMADHITNICERVIFMVTGEIVTEKEG